MLIGVARADQRHASQSFDLHHSVSIDIQHYMHTHLFIYVCGLGYGMQFLIVKIYAMH